jgi:NitT/TauT family transport system substrate-binding protein
MALLAHTALTAACGPAGSSAPAPAAPEPAPAAEAAPAAGSAEPPALAADRAVPLAPLPKKVVVSYSSVSSNFVAVWLAADAGLFAKHGLDAEITFLASGTTSLQSLVGGDIQFATTSGAEPTAAFVSGAPVQILMGWNPTLPSLFLVDPSITRPEQLRGKTIGITRFGGLPHVAARLALSAWGLDPASDVSYLQLPGTPEILAAMQQGIVAGGAYAPPTNLRAQRLGFRVLGDLNAMGIPYQSGVLVATPAYVEANPEAARRVIRALSEAIKVSLTDDEAARAAIAKYTRTDDDDLIAEALRSYRAGVQRIPYPSSEGLQTVLDFLAEDDPRVRAVRPQDVVNTALLEQVEREGFFRQLYGE